MELLSTLAEVGRRHRGGVDSGSCNRQGVIISDRVAIFILLDLIFTLLSLGASLILLFNVIFAFIALFDLVILLFFTIDCEYGLFRLWFLLGSDGVESGASMLAVQKSASKRTDL